MAMEKAVVVSNTHALSEIVSHGQTGLRFQKGSVEALAHALGQLVEEPELRRQLALAGRAWVLEHRTWRASGSVVVEGYRRVLELAASRARDIA
jgi:glycosyltransferase involved in cell wall biosynthesis